MAGDDCCWLVNMVRILLMFGSYRESFSLLINHCLFKQ
jgi:hypothetical protein